MFKAIYSQMKGPLGEINMFIRLKKTETITE